MVDSIVACVAVGDRRPSVKPARTWIAPAVLVSGLDRVPPIPFFGTQESAEPTPALTAQDHDRSWEHRSRASIGPDRRAAAGESTS